MGIIHVDSGSFQQEVLMSKEPVLVDFWATWCGPCRMLAPVVAQIAEEKEGELKVGKVNIDDQAELAIRYSIASIPTLMVFKDGQVAAKTVGAMPKSQLLSALGL